MHNKLLAKKIGMTQVNSTNGAVQPVTLVKLGECKVSLVRTTARDGYDAVQMQMHESGKVLGCIESRIDSTQKQYNAGDLLDANFIAVGGKVDVIATSKGRGFQGVMKRHGFKGLRATHGVKKVHRSGGSTGQNTHPGRVQRGKKMPGQFGNAQITVRNLSVVAFDQTTGLVALKGSVPGPSGAVIVVRRQIEA